MPRSQKIEPTSVTVTAVVKMPDGTIKISTSDGSTLSWTSLEEMLTFFIPLQNPDVALQLLLAWWIARSPDASNENLIEGKTLTLDLSAANPIKVQ